MIDKQDVIDFFDKQAPGWDEAAIRSDIIINTILDNAGVTAGKNVLDVACGTGILIPDYLNRNVGHVTAIDISPKMIEIAKEKFGGEPKVDLVCGDVEEDFSGVFDCIMVYNAFPHFPDPDRLIACLAGHLAPGGSLCVSHGMSREAIDSHHEGVAKHVSNGLMECSRLAEIFGKYLKVSVCISDDEMYQVVGSR